MPLRILLVNQYFPPDTSATAVILKDLMTEFARRGHEVTVLCGRPSYGTADRRPFRLLSHEYMGGIRVERVGSFAFDRWNVIGRTLNYLSYLALALLRSLTSRRPDVVIAATDPPLAIVVGLCAARGRPVVYSLRDLHPEAAAAAAMVRARPLVAAWDLLHRWALKRASLVVCLGRTMASIVVKKGVDPKRIRVVEDGAWPPSDEPDEKVVEEVRGQSKFVAMYAGNLGASFDWTKLVDADAILHDAEVVFVGEGAAEATLRSAGARIQPFRPPRQLPSVMAAADLQIVPLRRQMAGQVVPSKLFTALAHGRPVLAAVPSDSEVAQIVEEWGCGVVADPDNAEDIATKIQRCSEDVVSLKRMAERAKDAGKHFERGALLQRFVLLTEEIANG